MSPVHTIRHLPILLLTLVLITSSLAGVASGGGTGLTPVALPSGSAASDVTSLNPSGQYNVTFYESGLPAGTEWYVNLTNGQTFSSTSSYMPPFTEGNGSYSYFIASEDKHYKSSSPSGIFNVSGSSMSIPISFSLVVYSVVFTETDLPTGSKWFVNLSNGQSFNETSSVISFTESNGSYNYIIAVGNKIYSPSPSSGLFTIYGGSIAIVIVFSEVFYKVTFLETGLPSNTRWYLNESNGPSVFSNSNVAVMNLTNGTYTFSVATGNSDYFPLSSPFPLRISGQATSVSVKFALSTYPVSFSESGLPAGTKWYVNVSSPGQQSQTLSTSNGLISFLLQNGTYNYTIADVNPKFDLNRTNGTFVISGGPVSLGFAFLRFYSVTFNEAGLPGGIKWYLNVTDPQSFYSSATYITFKEPNGSYHYSISVGNPNFGAGAATSNGNFSVSGSDITPAPPNSPLRFYALHLVTFTEGRLPTDTAWYIDLTNGSMVESFNTTSNTISFLQQNGTYSYRISTSDNMYRPSPLFGSLKVSGWPLNSSKINLYVTFYLVTYSVLFTETGLTSGTPWSVTLNNTTRQSVNDTVIFDESNGTYQYIIEGLSGFNTSTYSGNLTVNGTAVNSMVTWQEVVYQLRIVQTGIAPGKHWSATLQGRTFDGISVNIVLNSTNGTVVFNVPNGTYNYTISPPLGYSGTHVTGTVVVLGASASEAAFLQAPNYLLIAMVLVLVAAALVVGLYIMVRRENRSVFKRELTKTERESFLRRRK